MALDSALVDRVCASAEKHGMYSFDIEHPPELDHHDPRTFRLAGCGFATPDLAVYVRDYDTIVAICRRLFPQKLDAIAFNGKFDIQCLVAAGVITSYQYPVQMVDPMIAVNLLDENRRPGEMGLKTIILEARGIKMMDFMTAWAFGEHSKEFEAYAIDDVVQELWLWQFCKPKLEAEKLMNLFSKISMPSSLVFADMELYGIGWDIDEAQRLLRGFQVFRDQLQKEIFAEIGPLNLNSGDQLAKRLFEELGYPSKGVEMTDSGKRLKVDTDTMDMLATKFPICEKIRAWRTCSKMIGTYVEPLTRMSIQDVLNRIHATFWLISATGRTRCEKPNFQNLPAWLQKRKGFENLNIRKAIIPGPQKTLIVADLSQIELRLCAHISQDPTFLKAFLDYRCTNCGTEGQSKVILHACPKCGCAENEKIMKEPLVKGFWHGDDLHTITTDSVPALGGDRQCGKMANFALIYNAQARRMHDEYPSLSLSGWQDVINQFMRKYYGIKNWHTHMEDTMKRFGVCTDTFGRKRRIAREDISRSFKHALNQFVNFPVQASACDYILLCMIKLREKWIAEGVWQKEIWLSNFVHDEIVAECLDGTEARYVADVRQVMEHACQFRVPIRTDIKLAKRWGDCK